MEQKKKRVYRKRIPYGMMNFEDVRKDDCYYVDKTPFIEEMEAANKFFFYIRPRRFGKSLTLSMLQNYYDVNQKDKFEQLFGDLYIGKHPTPERNSYLVLKLDFRWLQPVSMIIRMAWMLPVISDTTFFVMFMSSIFLKISRIR